MKCFAAVDIEQKRNDAKWLNKASEVIRLKWKDKNERAAKSRAHKLVNGVGQPACNGNNGQHEEQ